MLLHQLVKSKWINKKAKAVGRGNSSGKGNYSTRGLKGQGSRSGSSSPSWFEGGQTPLTQRLPKMRGFKRYFKLVDHAEILNLGQLEKDERITADAVINKALLKKLNYIKKEGTVKVLGNGDYTKKLQFEGIDLFSATAKEKIEKTGGSMK